MDFTDYLHKHYSPATAALYQRYLATWLSYMPEAESAGHADITRFLGHLRNRYQNPNTLNIYLHSIKAWYRWLQVTGKREDHPARSVVLRDKNPKEIRIQHLLNAAELQRLIQTAHNRNHKLSYRNKVLMSLLCHQGLLIGELVALTINAPDLAAGTIYIKGTGVTHNRELPLEAGQILLLHHYLTTIHPTLNKQQSNAFFLSANGRPLSGDDITKQVSRHCRKLLGGRKITARLIRQSVISEKLKNGGDTRVVQVFAGHKCPSTTEQYKQDDLEQLKAGILKYHPLG